MAFFDLEGQLVSTSAGKPIIKGEMKLKDVVNITSETVQDRLTTLGFRTLKANSSFYFVSSRLPGDSSPSSTTSTLPRLQHTLLLPHIPSAPGLWSENLTLSFQLDYSTVLPQVEQLLRLSSSSIIIASPSTAVSNASIAMEGLEAYQKDIDTIWNAHSETIGELNILAYGAGGAALILAMAMNTNLLRRINKIAFVDCEEVVGKALAHITKNKESSEDSKPWLASHVVTVLETRAIMIKMSAEVVGSVLKKTNESKCACPVISTGITNSDLVMFEGGALGVMYLRRKTPKPFPKLPLFAAIALVLALIFAITVITYR